MSTDTVRCYGCDTQVVPTVDDGERYCPNCGSTDLSGLARERALSAVQAVIESVREISNELEVDALERSIARYWDFEKGQLDAAESLLIGIESHLASLEE